VYPEGHTEVVRPIYRLLAPTSALTMNVDRPNVNQTHPDDPYTVTWKVQTGVISRIFIPGTRFTLHESDGEAPKEQNRRPGRQRRRERQYTPLRSRRV
jgi:hypothetical protein